MDDELALASALDLADLTTFMSRAATLGCEHVRLSAHGNALVVSVAVLTRASLLDTTPIVLGVRIFELAVPSSLDRVILVRALADRLAHGELTLPMPPAVPGVSWSGVAPPSGGWVAAGSISESELEVIAREGISEVASVSGKGTLIVARVRTEVWSRTRLLSDIDVPAGVAFAAYGLGFLTPDAGDALEPPEVNVSRAANWSRFSTPRGHILLR
nr:MAG: hypothetical protein GM42_4065 [actinobacterium acMicro-1]